MTARRRLSRGEQGRQALAHTRRALALGVARKVLLVLGLGVRKLTPSFSNKCIARRLEQAAMESSWLRRMF
jgi:hypothetical protein